MYPEIKRTKEKKDLYTENYKTFLEETKENTNKLKYTQYLWIGRCNFVTVSILLKVI